MKISFAEDGQVVVTKKDGSLHTVPVLFIDVSMLLEQHMELELPNGIRGAILGVTEDGEVEEIYNEG